MNKEIEKQISIFDGANKKIYGLYRKWTQKRDMNYYIAGLLYKVLKDGPITQKEFAESNELPKQTVGNIINDLKEKEYIVLVPSTQDKRQKYIHLTEKGTEYAREKLEPLYTIEESAVKKFGQEEMELLNKLIVEYSEILEWEMERKEKKEK